VVLCNPADHGRPAPAGAGSGGGSGGDDDDDDVHDRDDDDDNDLIFDRENIEHGGGRGADGDRAVACAAPQPCAASLVRRARLARQPVCRAAGSQLDMPYQPLPARPLRRPRNH